MGSKLCTFIIDLNLQSNIKKNKSNEQLQRKKSDEIIRDPPWNSLSFKSVVQKNKLAGGSQADTFVTCVLCTV